MIGSNNITADGRGVSCELRIFELINDQGVVGLSETKVQAFRGGSIMDIKSFKYFDGKNYIALALNSFVQIFQFDKDNVNNELLIPKFKIDT